jgi:uncharacterized protein (TIGR03118 family)
MMRSSPFQTAILTSVALGALCAFAGTAQAQFNQTNLVSDVPNLATLIDPNLVNPWGVSFQPAGGSPFWISNQGTSTSSLYSVTGRTGVAAANFFPALSGPNTNFVAIPTTAAGPQGPTGQVANHNPSSFDVGNGGGSALFIFANLNGTISAWNLSNINAATQNAATVKEPPAGDVYTGLAINNAGTRLYSVNAAAGDIDVLNTNFADDNTLPPDAFATPASISALGLVPFNVQDINGTVYVTYSPPGRPAQIAAGLGEGAVAVFDENGVFQSKSMVGGNLASPWGIAIAPAGFGPFGGDLLVGNFSFLHSGINAFDLTTGAFEGTIPIDPGAGNMPGGLWALTFGGGGSAGDPMTLYFTDGIDGETHGLFGAITVPEPSTWAMLLIGFGGLALFAARRRGFRAIS